MTYNIQLNYIVQAYISHIQFFENETLYEKNVLLIYYKIYLLTFCTLIFA